MANGPLRLLPGASSQSFYTHSSSHHSSHKHPNHQFDQYFKPSRFGFGEDNPVSPTRSPPEHSPPHEASAMFGQNHQPGHNVFMNGGHGHSRFGMHMNTSKPFQSGSQHHQSHAHRSQHDHLAQGNYMNHQHNSSTSGLSSTTPQFNPAQLRNSTPSHAPNGISRHHNEHWSLQIQYAQQAREATDRHHWAKNTNLNKGPSSNAPDGSRKEVDPEERNRATGEPDATPLQWDTLDISGLGLRALATQMFAYSFLRKLFLNNNKLTFLPPEIGRLRNLVHLDVSSNELADLPAEIGMLVNLKELWLFYNQLEALPTEIGSLYQLELLGIEGNPLHDEIRTMMIEEGSKAMVTTLRESAPAPPPPMDREVRTVTELRPNAAGQEPDSFSVMSYNTLCDKYATQTTYGYASRSALAWENRRQTIMEEILGRGADIICLQEVDSESYNQFFKGELARHDYRGHFWPRSRAKTMTDKEAKAVDGCATFVRNSKYTILDRQHIDFAYIAINKPDMKHTADVFNRVMPRDNIAIVMFVEERRTGHRLIIVNAHLFWDPVYEDVKLVQAAILMEQVNRLAERYSKRPACTNVEKSAFRFANEDSDPESTPPESATDFQPSQEYASGTAVPLIVCGDFNSLPQSGVFDLLNSGTVAPNHPDFRGHTYGNFTRAGMAHPFQLKSAYGSIEELGFTNYTPGFTGVIDYVWYSTNALQVTELLGDVDADYLQRVPGFPNMHFPSDHLALMARFVVRQRKEGQKGPENDRSGKEGRAPAD